MVQESKCLLATDDQETEELTPPGAEEGEAETALVRADAREAAVADLTAQTDDHSVEPLVGVSLVEGPGLAVVRFLTAILLGLVHHLLGSGIVVELQVLEGHFFDPRPPVGEVLQRDRRVDVDPVALALRGQDEVVRVVVVDDDFKLFCFRDLQILSGFIFNF